MQTERLAPSPARGHKSPNPTVVIVTIAHQKLVMMEGKNSGVPRSSQQRPVRGSSGDPSCTDYKGHDPNAGKTSIALNIFNTPTATPP